MVDKQEEENKGKIKKEAWMTVIDLQIIHISISVQIQFWKYLHYFHIDLKVCVGKYTVSGKQRGENKD